MPSIWITSKSRPERSHVDQHLVHGPFAEPVRRNSGLPAWHSQFLPVEAAKPWPLDLNLAAVEADLAPRFPPPMRPPQMASRMVGPADRLCVVIHHLAKRLHAGSQAKQLKARRNIRKGFELQRQ